MFKCCTRYKNGGKYTEKRKISGIIVLCVILAVLFFLLILFSDGVKYAILAVVGWLDPDFDKVLFVCNLNQEKDFVGSAIWTMTTILSGFIIMYYENLEFRNYGMSNRVIFRHYYGSYFIPGLTAFNVLIVCLMTYMYYAGACADFYILSICSCILQGLLIIFCVWPATHKKAAEIVLAIEEKQFQILCNENGENWNGNVSRQIDYENRAESKMFMQHILSGDEYFDEKEEIIIRILTIPVRQDYYTVRKKCFLDTVYRYEYRNIFCIAAFALKNPDNIQQMYSVLYESVVRIYEGAQELKRKELVYAYLGALFHVLIPHEKFEKRWDFFTQLLNNAIVDRRIRGYLVLELLACMILLSLTGEIDLGKMMEAGKITDCFETLEYEGRIQEYIGNIYSSASANSCEESGIFHLMFISWANQIGARPIERMRIIFKIEENLCGSSEDAGVDYLKLILQKREWNKHDTKATVSDKRSWRKY